MTLQSHIISTLSASFDLPLRKHQIPDFRKRVWGFVGMGEDIFHNHRVVEGEITGRIHRYPLIQYRTYQGFAHIWAMQEGVVALQNLLTKPHFLPLKSPLSLPHSFDLAWMPSPQKQLYKLFGYVPFSKQSYQEYQNALTFREKITILERVLTHQLVAFAHAAAWEIDLSTPIEVELHDITEVGRAVYQPADKSPKNIFTAFDLSFYANVQLPDQAGIGNLTALGYGLLKRWEEINH
jgi:hypothetical protein